MDKDKKLYRHSTSYYRKCKRKIEAQKSEVRKRTLKGPCQLSVNLLETEAHPSASIPSFHQTASSSQLIKSNVQITNDNIQNNNKEELESDDFEIEDSGNYDSGNDDFESEDSAVIKSLKLTEDLKKWTAQHKPTTSSLNDLLGIINKYGFILPKDGRSLLKTDYVDIKAMEQGQFWYQGVRKNLEENISAIDLSSVSNIELLINVDGMSLFNSTASEIWPIALAIYGMPNIKPMFAAIYYGNGKPPLELFLREFINEMNYLIKEGMIIKEKKLNVTIKCFVCDTPARAYLKGTPSFNARRSSCIKCTVEGIWDRKGRHMSYPMFQCPLRTNASFRSKLDEDHHVHETPLVELPIDMVEDFIVADSLHLFDLGDLNLPRDKFLREQVQLDDGWVPLDILTRFNRLAKLTLDTDVIAKALVKSPTGLLEVSEDSKRVRRNPELPVPEMNEERRKEVSSRTIYAKGFPKESILDDILKYYKQFEEVENVIMRKYPDRATKKKLFKGSIFATFKTKEQAEKYIETKGHKYEDTELLIHWQDEYIKQKQEEYATKKEQRDKKVKEKESKEETTKEEFKLPTGTVLHFSEGTDKMKREDVKDALTAIGADVAYIDFKVGDKEGWVRLSKENTAKDLADKLTDGKLKITEAEVLFKVLSEEDEKVYLDKTVDEMSKRRKNMRNFKGNRGRRGGGNNKYGGRKRRQDYDDGPPKKVKASDS